ncbi:hypothetical protein LshimejAT787_1602610 [Lyophyllum shimeji]|uniref:Uncharacterized protein n=1 Tax=Lyophyllum shimeji TaxID=47721 RepID=A0A9P3PZ75_LYOSH|nr:hypothetical protein LshimejAT787_1602610 [Lyophyllum shimeji]
METPGAYIYYRELNLVREIFGQRGSMEWPLIGRTGLQFLSMSSLRLSKAPTQSGAGSSGFTDKIDLSLATRIVEDVFRVLILQYTNRRDLAIYRRPEVPLSRLPKA